MKLSKLFEDWYEIIFKWKKVKKKKKQGKYIEILPALCSCCCNTWTQM